MNGNLVLSEWLMVYGLKVTLHMHTPTSAHIQDWLRLLLKD